MEPIRAKSLFPRGFVEIKPWFRLAPSPQLEILDAAIDAFDEGTAAAPSLAPARPADAAQGEKKKKKKRKEKKRNFQVYILFYHFS